MVVLVIAAEADFAVALLWYATRNGVEFEARRVNGEASCWEIWAAGVPICGLWWSYYEFSGRIGAIGF